MINKNEAFTNWMRVLWNIQIKHRKFIYTHDNNDASHLITYFDTLASSCFMPHTHNKFLKSRLIQYAHIWLLAFERHIVWHAIELVYVELYNVHAACRSRDTFRRLPVVSVASLSDLVQCHFVVFFEPTSMLITPASRERERQAQRDH